jgi:carbamoylphosphate synthase small subunit
MESEKVHLAGIVVRDLSVAVSNYRATMSLDEYCKKEVRVCASSQTNAHTRTHTHTDIHQIHHTNAGHHGYRRH